ncbi:hypothetical protein [Sphingomonas guangdongensis]|uniref:hypothetical protein n=1 Tax=Sphingomonas guangdongensis TaxID=1141890 RepID=UPI0015C8B67E|nr:hypothetical protein [Sphingomonas guangdongensis]
MRRRHPLRANERRYYPAGPERLPGEGAGITPAGVVLLCILAAAAILVAVW